MQRLRRRRAHASSRLALVWGCAVALGGCASPGPPHPPSLHLPRVVSDLSATRSGDTVELHFTVPTHTTDGQLLKESSVSGALCRQVGKGPCSPVDSAQTEKPLAVPMGDAQPVLWTDSLPAALLSGPARVIAYRVALRNAAGRTAGYSDPAYAAAGPAPLSVTDLRAEGTRLGVALRWAPAPHAGEVLLERREPAPVRPERHATTEAARGGSTKAPRAGEARTSHRQADAAGVLWLQASPGDSSASATMDGGVEPGVPYTYSAVRRETVRIGGRTLEVRSAPSASVSITWRDVYPPATPQGLAALGYTVPASGTTSASSAGAAPGGYAVDLVWQPVEDPRLAGYLVYRQAVNSASQPSGSRTRLTLEPVVTPGFHDATAQPDTRYRYSVTAIDPKGNESPAAETIVEPSAAP